MLPEAIRNILADEGLNQKQLAAELSRQFSPTGKGYSAAAISMILAGKRRPEVTRMMWLAEHGEGVAKRFALAAIDEEVERRR